MATRIEWTDETWNPVTGCAKVSPGCEHCYAETFYERFNGKGSFANVKLHSERLAQPLRWRKPRSVFVNSMSDLFHADVPDAFIAETFAVMAVCQQHTFQILTKRHGRMRALLTSAGFRDAVLDRQHRGVQPQRGFTDTWPLPNMWLGVSVETQQWADIRVPALLETPAAVRFLSCEPLLGPVDLKRAVIPMGDQRGHGLTASFVHAGNCCRRFHGIDWVIAGAESGPGARAMDEGWVRSVRDQCAVAGVAFFYKQNAINGRKVSLPELDGRTWDQYPEAVAT